MERPDKKQIASCLEEMGTILELQGANPFKSRAFHNAARVLEGVTEDIGDLVEQGRLREIKGIGESLSVIIADLVRTGSSAEYESLKASLPSGLIEMLRIQGLGPKRVKILHDRLKIVSIDALESAAKAGKLAGLEGFGEKTQENILAGIESLRHSAERTLYPVAAVQAAAILERIRAVPGVKRAEVAGSLRRRKETIGDIDIIVSAGRRDQERVMEAFASHPLIGTVNARGETKSSATLKSGMQCDLRIVDDSEYAFALAYFTGSKEHNVALRSRAKDFGWSMNEYGFSRLGDEETRGKAKRAVPCKDETDIYKALKLQYVPPELREDMGEIEAAEKRELPELIGESDIKGTFHCHTTYSDGVNTLEAMASAAKALGWQYLGIADHSKVAAYARGLSPERVKQQHAEIDALNAKLKNFRVFKGTECDILADGELDWPERILSSFDFVVVSVHSSFRMSEKDMTRRIVKALKNKHVTMLGHPTGRLLLTREGYPVNMPEVIQAAADLGKVIEINADAQRLDLDWRLCRFARDKGVMISINPDAHSVDGLRGVFTGVGIARKGWLRAGDVLNTRTASDIEKIFQRDRK
jgi:DNA polymerase (family 10)